MAKHSNVAEAVLDFYQQLPFNQQSSTALQAESILSRNSILAYPVLPPLLSQNSRVLEVGCGTGWFANSMAYYYPVAVTGIDFNPVAIEFARRAAAELNLYSQFVNADLFTYQAELAFDGVVSIGVLHHTHDCLAALRRVASLWVKPGGWLFLGLYHHYGRRPFLDHFELLRQQGQTESELFARYRQLHPYLTDDIQAYSWFRDQVLHPYETQHTVAELIPVLAESGLTIKATSINQFQPMTDVTAIVKLEPERERSAANRLANNQYDPGFFLVLAQKPG